MDNRGAERKHDEQPLKTIKTGGMAPESEEGIKVPRRKYHPDQCQEQDVAP